MKKFFIILALLFAVASQNTFGQAFAKVAHYGKTTKKALLDFKKSGTTSKLPLSIWKKAVLNASNGDETLWNSIEDYNFRPYVLLAQANTNKTRAVPVTPGEQIQMFLNSKLKNRLVSGSEEIYGRITHKTADYYTFDSDFDADVLYYPDTCNGVISDIDEALWECHNLKEATITQPDVDHQIEYIDTGSTQYIDTGSTKYVPVPTAPNQYPGGTQYPVPGYPIGFGVSFGFSVPMFYGTGYVSHGGHMYSYKQPCHTQISCPKQTSFTPKPTPRPVTPQHTNTGGSGSGTNTTGGGGDVPTGSGTNTTGGGGTGTNTTGGNGTSANTTGGSGDKMLKANGNNTTAASKSTEASGWKAVAPAGWKGSNSGNSESSARGGSQSKSSDNGGWKAVKPAGWKDETSQSAKASAAKTASTQKSRQNQTSKTNQSQQKGQPQQRGNQSKTGTASKSHTATRQNSSSRQSSRSAAPSGSNGGSSHNMGASYGGGGTPRGGSSHSGGGSRGGGRSR